MTVNNTAPGSGEELDIMQGGGGLSSAKGVAKMEL